MVHRRVRGLVYGTCLNETPTVVSSLSIRLAGFERSAIAALACFSIIF